MGTQMPPTPQLCVRAWVCDGSALNALPCTRAEEAALEGLCEDPARCGGGELVQRQRVGSTQQQTRVGVPPCRVIVRQGLPPGPAE